MKKQKVEISPHLALTSIEHQDGAANGRNVSLLMKSDLSSLTEDQVALLKSIIGEEEEVEKATLQSVRKDLQEALEGISSDYFLVDADSSVVVYSEYISDYPYWELWAEDYTVEDGQVMLSGQAVSVKEVLTFETDSGEVVLSESRSGDVTQEVMSLIKSNINNLSGEERLRDALKSEKEEITLMQEEIQKAVASALEPVQQKLEKAVEEKEALEAKLEEIHKAAAEQKQSDRLEALKKAVACDEQAEALRKSLEAVEDEAFEQVLKSLSTKNEQVESSALFKQMSQEGEVQEQQESHTARLLKAEFGQE